MYYICIIQTWTFTVVWLRVRFTELKTTTHAWPVRVRSLLTFKKKMILLPQHRGLDMTAG